MINNLECENLEWVQSSQPSKRKTLQNELQVLPELRSFDYFLMFSNGIKELTNGKQLYDINIIFLVSSLCIV